MASTTIIPLRSSAPAPPAGGQMQERVRLMHLSDIHFGREDKTALDAAARFAADIKPDAIIVAGDITQRGRRSEFAAARAWFDSLGCRVIIAPGNHDTPWSHLALRALRPFARYARSMDGLDALGQLIELNEGAVRICAINTARGMQARLNWADGVIDLTDLTDALDRLSAGPPEAWRVLICHHPLHEPAHSQVSVDTRRGAHALELCARAHVDIILTGHIHDAFAHSLRGARRPLVQMGSGTLSRRTRASPAGFCLVEITGGRLTQDLISVSRTGLATRRLYDSGASGERRQPAGLTCPAV